MSFFKRTSNEKLVRDYQAILKLFRAANREAIEKHFEPCPECGLCNPEWQANCGHKDWCPILKNKI